MEAYAEYAHRIFKARGGRQLLANRLGIVGFDGGRITAPVAQSGLEVDAYVGLGLARATAIPVYQSGPESAGRLPAGAPANSRWCGAGLDRTAG